MISNAKTNFSGSALNLLINNRFQLRFNLLAPWEFRWKTRFEASRIVFWSLSYYKELELTKSRSQVVRFAAFHSRCKILPASEVRAWVLKWHNRCWFLLFAFLPFFFVGFSPPPFFSFAGHLLAFISVKKVFGKVVRIVGLDGSAGG